MPLNDWIVDGEQTKRITVIFRPRRGLEAKLLQAIDAAEKRNPCVGYLVVDVPSTFLETTKRRYFNPDDLMKAEQEGTARYGVANSFEYFVRIPLNEKGAQANLVEVLKMEEDKTVGIPFAPKLLENPEQMGLYEAIKLTKSGAHFLTIRRYSEERPDVLEVTLVDPLNKNNIIRRKTRKTKITNSEIFKETIPIVNQYVNRIFRALDEKGLVKY